MDSLPDDYWDQQVLFPELGGVTGVVTVACPHCSRDEAVPVDADGGCPHRCSHCGQVFSINNDDE